MSDPVTDVEIEDVLSSIRRLVGDEHRAKPQMAPQMAPKPEPVEAPVKPTRLVLTPSLLVPVPDIDPGGDSKPALVPDTQEQLSKAPSVPDTDTDTDTDTESVREEFEFKPEAEPTNDAATKAETAFVFQSSQAHDRASAENESDQAAWTDPETTLFNAAEIGDSTDLSDSTGKNHAEDNGRPIWEALKPQEIAAPFDATPQAVPNKDAPEPTDPEPTDPDQPVIVDIAGDRLDADANQSDPGNSFATDSDDAGNTGSDSDPEDDTPYSTATLGAKIAALEAKIGQTQDQWEPDGELGDDYAGTKVETIEWQDHDAKDQFAAGPSELPPTQPKPAPDISDEVTDQPDSTTDFTETAARATQEPANPARQNSDDSIDLLAGDDAVLDEESLRELVAEIVRQELQGALGERITRNVRKLVRREIHRALTAQELD
ncbi:MAG: hypothetical protein L3J36_07040 [Rhodobacteraceae bacterium]|nr:hypothetical protein [Paracoccaceae bacterium]